MAMTPEAALTSWPGRRREIFYAVVHQQGLAIYDASGRSGAPYRSAFDQVKALIAQALIHAIEDRAGARAKRRRYSIR